MENRNAKTEPKELPPASRTLGLRVIEKDQDAGRVTAEFEARQEFCNPLGIIQGGFLVAMLDEVMAIAAVVHSRKTVLVPTLEIKVSFLNAARPGTLRGVGEVVRLSKSGGLSGRQPVRRQRRAAGAVQCHGQARPLSRPVGPLIRSVEHSSNGFVQPARRAKSNSGSNALCHYS